MKEEINLDNEIYFGMYFDRHLNEISFVFQSVVSTFLMIFHKVPQDPCSSNIRLYFITKRVIVSVISIAMNYFHIVSVVNVNILIYDVRSFSRSEMFLIYPVLTCS